MSLLDFVGNFSLGSDSPPLSAGLGELYGPNPGVDITGQPTYPGFTEQDFGAFDPGSFEIPDLALPDWWSGGGGADGGSSLSSFAGPAIESLYDFNRPWGAELAFAGGESGLMFNTSTGKIFDPRTQAELPPDQAAQIGQGWEAAYEQPEGPMSMEQIQQYVSGRTGSEAYSNPVAAAADRAADGGWLGTLNAALRSPLGSLAAAGLIGAGGLGAARLAAGPAPRLRLPTYTPAPATQAGQEAVLRALQGGGAGNLTGILQAGTAGERLVAEQLAARAGRESAAEVMQAPGQEAIRWQAQNQIPGLLTPNVADPVLDAIRAELLGTLNNPQGGVNPATVQRQQQEEAQIRNQLTQQLGRDYELTTAGGQALNQMRQRHNIERFTERQATIANLTPLEQGALGAQFGRQQAGLGTSAAFSQFGIRGVPETLTGLERLAPTEALMGGDPERANTINTNLAQAQALQGFNAANEERRGLAAGIAGLSGTIAGQVASRPSRYEDAVTAMINRQLGTGSLY